jgi:hypothetical protein
MKSFSLFAGVLGCALLVLVAPGAASAGVVLQVDDVSDSPSVAVTSGSFLFGGLQQGLSIGADGTETLIFTGFYTGATPFGNTPAVTHVYLLEPPGEPNAGAVSDILTVIFASAGGTNVFVNGVFVSDGDPSVPPLTIPEGTPQSQIIVENGTFQDVSAILQAQGAPTDFSISVRSDVETAVPEPASLIVWSFVACGMGVPVLRRRWARNRVV